MSDTSSIEFEKSRIMRATMLWVTDLLLKRCNDPERIAARVRLMNFELHKFYDGTNDGPKQKDLAALLNVSEARVSIALADVSKAIETKLKG